MIANVRCTSYNSFVFKFISSHPEWSHVEKIDSVFESGEENSRGFARDGEYTSPQKEILDSIQYARRILMAQIPSDRMVDQVLKRLRKVGTR